MVIIMVTTAMSIIRIIRAHKKRILSSLLFSGVLSIPGRAAATRRNN